MSVAGEEEPGECVQKHLGFEMMQTKTTPLQWSEVTGCSPNEQRRGDAGNVLHFSSNLVAPCIAAPYLHSPLLKPYIPFLSLSLLKVEVDTVSSTSPLTLSVSSVFLLFRK